MKTHTTLDEFIPNKAELARKLGCAPNTVYKWVARNSLPPGRVMKVSTILNLAPKRLLPFAQQVSGDSKTKKKRFRDLDVLLAAYKGEPWKATSTLTPHAVNVTLGHWKERLPLMVDTLKAVKAGGVSRREAAEKLGVAYSTVKQLVERYDAAPPKIEKPQTRVARNRELAPDAVNDAIRGRLTAKEAAAQYGIDQRTLHRKIKAALKGRLGLNALSHWSTNFRTALAWEVANDAPSVVEAWKTQHPDLPRQPKWPQIPDNLRQLSGVEVVILLLTGDLEVHDVVKRRGGSKTIWGEQTHMQLERFGIYNPPSPYHEAAAAEILLNSLQKPRENRKNSMRTQEKHDVERENRRNLDV